MSDTIRKCHKTNETATPEGLLAHAKATHRAARDPSGKVAKVEQEKRAVLYEILPFLVNLTGLNSNQIMLDLRKINGLRGIINYYKTRCLAYKGSLSGEAYNIRIAKLLEDDVLYVSSLPAGVYILKVDNTVYQLLN
jgi:hypothetical protein